MGTINDEVTIERHEEDRRDSESCRQTDAAVEDDRRKMPRRVVKRRRQIDPTTCERDYSNDEIEFMQALDVYKRANGRMFPTCSEILEVVRGIGYVRLTPEELEYYNGSEVSDDESELSDEGEFENDAIDSATEDE